MLLVALKALGAQVAHSSTMTQAVTANTRHFYAIRFLAVMG
jgi:hypothetical protein